MRYESDNMSGVRRSNRAAVLCLLHEQGGLSRKRLAEQLGLTPAAITKIVSELRDEGLLLEGETLPGAGAGRREITLSCVPRARCALGVNLGLERAILSGVWLDGEVIFSETVPLPVRAPAEETVAALAARLTALSAAHGLPERDVLGVGVAVRGLIGADGRSVCSSFDALDAEDYPICRRFEELTGLPALLSNNVRALFAAELYLSRAPAVGSCFFLRIGSGIGAAFSMHGNIWEGDGRRSAEIGHIPVVRQGGRPCHCGKTGCLETIAAPGAICAAAAERLSPSRTPLLWQRARETDAPLTVFDVLDAARGGDAGAAEAADGAITALASALKSALYLLDPGRLVLYGEVFDHPYFLTRLRAEMALGVDPSHTAPMEISRFNGILDERAAGLLVAARFMENGGIRR